MSLKENDIFNENLFEKRCEYNLRNFAEKKDSWSEFVSNTDYRCVICGKEVAISVASYFKNKYSTWKKNQFGSKELDKLDKGFCCEIQCWDCQHFNK